MSFRSLIRSNKGFSLVEMSVATGLVGIIVLIVVFLSDNLSQVTRQSELSLSKLELVSLIGRHVKSSRGCEDLRGITFSATTGTEIVLDDMPIGGLREVVGSTGSANSIVEDTDIRAGRVFKNFRIDSLTGTFVNQGDIEFSQAGPAGIQGTNLRKGFIRVTARISFLNSSRKDPADPSSWITSTHHVFLPVVARPVTNGFEISSCLTDATLGQTCTALGGAYDPLVGSCDNIPNNCYLQGAYSTGTGGGVNNPATGGPSCPDGTTARKIGNDQSGATEYYLCMRCPPVVVDPDRSAPETDENFVGNPTAEVPQAPSETQ